MSEALKALKSRRANVLDALSGIKCLREYPLGSNFYLCKNKYRLYLSITGRVSYWSFEGKRLSTFGEFFETLEPDEQEEFLFHLDVFAKS